VSDGGEDEVLEMDGGVTERPDHVHRAAVAHWPLRRGQCSGRATWRYRATSSQGVLWLKVIPMHALGRAEIGEMRLASKDRHRQPWRTRLVR
jgi:hypothetical protein